MFREGYIERKEDVQSILKVLAQFELQETCAVWAPFGFRRPQLLPSLWTSPWSNQCDFWNPQQALAIWVSEARM